MLLWSMLHAYVSHGKIHDFFVLWLKNYLCLAIPNMLTPSYQDFGCHFSWELKFSFSLTDIWFNQDHVQHVQTILVQLCIIIKLAGSREFHIFISASGTNWTLEKIMRLVVLSVCSSFCVHDDWAGTVAPSCENFYVGGDMHSHERLLVWNLNPVSWNKCYVFFTLQNHTWLME